MRIIDHPRTPTASEFAAALQRAIQEHGDLPIVGGYIHDDTPVRSIIPVDMEGVSPEDSKKAGKPIGFFLSNHW